MVMLPNTYDCFVVHFHVLFYCHLEGTFSLGDVYLMMMMMMTIEEYKYK